MCCLYFCSDSLPIGKVSCHCLLSNSFPPCWKFALILLEIRKKGDNRRSQRNRKAFPRNHQARKNIYRIPESSLVMKATFPPNSTETTPTMTTITALLNAQEGINTPFPYENLEEISKGPGQRETTPVYRYDSITQNAGNSYKNISTIQL